MAILADVAIVRPLLRFALVAGCGWLLDAALLLAMTRGGLLSPFVANLLSSLAAAAFVFLVSRRRVHDGRSDAVPARLGLYLGYTLALIVASSWVLAMIVPTMLAMMPRVDAVLAAKVAITPPQFLLNFIVSRELARRGLWHRQ